MEVPASDGIVRPNNGNCVVSSNCVDVAIGDICGNPLRPVMIDVGIAVDDLLVPMYTDGKLDCRDDVLIT
jgi:hypothetical protein